MSPNFDTASTRSPASISSAPFKSPKSVVDPATDPMEMELVALRGKVEFLEKSLLNRQPKEVTTHIWEFGVHDYIQKALGLNPCAHESEFVSFQDSYVSFERMGGTSLRNYGPLSWVALIKSEPAVAPIIEYKRNAIIKAQKTRGPDTVIDLFATSSTADALVNEELEFKSLKVGSRESRPLHEKLAEFNAQARNLGFTVCSTDLLQVPELVDKIRILIPQEKAMWKYIEIFFTRTYAFLPLLDQEVFEGNVRRLVKFSKSNSNPQLQVEKQMDLVHLAHLLLVLRFGYLELFPSILESSSITPKDEDREFLLDNPVAIEAPDVAELCLHLFNYIRTCNLPVLQLLLFLKVYHLYGPENGNTPEDTNSQALPSFLLKMGMSLGLHREPENLKTANKDKRSNNLRRKIWYCLLFLDYEGSITNGLPVSIQKNSFDTELPHYERGSENVRDENAEKVLAAQYYQINSCFELTGPILEQISSVRIPIALRNLCGDLSTWEHKYFKNMTLPLNSANQPLTVTEIYNSVVFFNMASIYVTTLYHMFLHYIKTGNTELAYFYLKKLLVAAIQPAVVYSKRFTELSDTWFAENSHVVFVPAFQNFSHRAAVVLQAILVRARFSILKCETLKDHSFNLANDTDYVQQYQTLKSIFDKSTKCLLIIVESIIKLSSRYCYSWRCSRAQENLKLARNGEDYYLNYCRGKEAYLSLTTEMKQDLDLTFSDILDEVKGKTRGDRGRSTHSLAESDSTVEDINLIHEGMNFSTDYANLFWLQMNNMKGQPEELMDPIEVSFFNDTPFGF